MGYMGWRLRRVALAATSAVALGVGMVISGATPVAADYGNTAVRQIEISANSTGPDGGGAWLWIELNGNRTGTYAGSDCGHGSGAVSDQGDVTWTTDGNTITIHGVVLNGLPPFLQPPAVTVPFTLGHYDYPAPAGIAAVFGLPFPGFAQVQVAP